jgi:hypothetical protein
MDECQAMACGEERSPTIITTTLAPSSCHRKQASLGATDESAHPLLNYSSVLCPLSRYRVTDEAACGDI